MSDNLTRWLRNAFAVAVLVGIIVLSVSQKNVLLQVVESWTARLFLSVVVLLLLQNLSQFLTLPALLRPFGVVLGIGESMRVGAVSGLVGAVGPLQAGTAYKAVYLKFAKRLQTANVVSVLLVQNVLRLLVCLLGTLYAIASARDVWFLPTPVVSTVTVTVLVAVMVALGFCLLFVAHRRLVGRVSGFYGELKDGLRLFAEKPVSLLIAVVFQMLQLALNASVFFLLLDAAGFTVPLSLLIGYVCLKYVANLVALIPFNLGISEILTGLLATSLGAPLALGVAIAFQVRVINLLMLSALALAFIRWRGPVTNAGMVR